MAKDHSHVEKIVHPLAQSLGSTAALLVVAALAVIWLFTRPLFDHRQDWQDAATVPVTLLTFMFIFILQRSYPVHVNSRKGLPLGN